MRMVSLKCDKCGHIYNEKEVGIISINVARDREMDPSGNGYIIQDFKQYDLCFACLAILVQFAIEKGAKIK